MIFDRFDRTLLETIPENVMVVDWFPQQDLLGNNMDRNDLTLTSIWNFTIPISFQQDWVNL